LVSDKIPTENIDFKLRDTLLKPSNKRMHIEEIFCDLAKAFGSVNLKLD
jgi:hypothetical protein